MSDPNTDKDPRNNVADPMESGIYRVVSLAAVILGFAVVAVYYPDLGSRIPIHFGLDGTPDRYGPKFLLWLLPLLNLGLFYFLGKAAGFSVDSFNYPVPITEDNAEVQHGLALELLAQVRLFVSLLLAYLTYQVVLVAATPATSIDLVGVGVLLGLMFGAIGLNLIRARRAG